MMGTDHPSRTDQGGVLSEADQVGIGGLVKGQDGNVGLG